MSVPSSGTPVRHLWLFGGFVVLALANYLESAGILEMISYVQGSVPHYYRDTGLEIDVLGRAWLGHLLSLAGVLFLLLSSLGYAVLAMRWLRRGGVPARSFAVMMGVGLGGAGVVGWGMGLCGLFDRYALAIFLLPGLAYALARWRRHVPRSGLADLSLGSWEARLILAALGVMGAASLLMSMGPEGGWDAVYYHLHLPKLYVMHHKVYFVPHVYPGGFPQLVESLYGLAWLLGGEEPAKLLNFAFWPLAGAALWRLAIPFGRQVALRAVGLALTIPLVGTEAAENYVDLGLSFFAVLAVTEAWRGNVALAGLFLGFAMGTKYTGIIPALAVGAGLVLARGGVGKIGWMAVVSSVAMVPWLAKNALMTGNPIAPFFHSSLSTLEWSWGIDQISLNRWKPGDLLPREAGGMASPFLVGLWNFLEIRQFETLSPFVLGMMPVLIMRSSGAYHAYLRILVVSATLMTLALCPGPKFYMPVLLPLSVVVAASWLSLGTAGRTARVFFDSVAGLSILFCVAYHVIDMHRVLPRVYGVALGLMDRAFYYREMRRPRGIYEAIRYTNRTVPRGERVAVISNHNAYLHDRGTVFDNDMPRMERYIHVVMRRRDTEAGLARQFRQWNARTVLYVRPAAAAMGEGEVWSKKEIRAMAGFWNGRAVHVGSWGPCSVYHLRGSAGDGRPTLDLPGPQGPLVAAMDQMTFDDKRSALRRAVADGMESGYLYGVYGAWAINARAIEEANESLAKATEIAPDRAEFWYWRAHALLAGGRVAKGKVALDRAIRLMPEHALRAQLEGMLRTPVPGLDN